MPTPTGPLPDLAPGDWCVVATNGWQAKVIRWVTRSPVNHAILYIGNGQIIEAQPKGAVIRPVTNYSSGYWSTGHVKYGPGQGAQIAYVGRAFEGVPYSWLDDACIGLAHLVHWHVPISVRRALSWVWDPVKRRLRRVDRLECAQLVDAACLAAGVHLFDDGRAPGDVAPSDLFTILYP